MKLIILLAAMLAFSAATPTIMDQWTSFKRQHGKKYNSIEEEMIRMTIFNDNLKLIAEHNAKYEAGQSTYYLGMNQYGDMLPEEVTLNGFNRTRDVDQVDFLPPANVEIPESINWRELGAVTPVKSQGTCRSCWAFSITGAIEGQIFRKTGKIVSLSEQQLVDCSKNYKNLGCGGGYLVNSFKYLMDVEGLESEDSYPYEAGDYSCRYSKSKVVPGTKVKAYSEIESKNDEALKAAVATAGPISTAVSSSNPHFILYRGGIFDGDTCNPDALDHGILLVGYGSDNGEDYWLIKNSWSPRWGEKGYMRLTRAKKNVCGISASASYPILL